MSEYFLLVFCSYLRLTFGCEVRKIIANNIIVNSLVVNVSITTFWYKILALIKVCYNLVQLRENK